MIYSYAATSPEGKLLSTEYEQVYFKFEGAINQTQGHASLHKQWI